ncbi:MAG TPA: choice-of-anchor tandem repeat GloVer-containing protein, partial [Thermoanaerobaculia bacterium]|nr:choice-of-anchor tandem repeat GloVer-containing protein [Thermoanaerobaculia bacterium]
MRYAKHARPVTGDAAHAHSIRRLVRPVLSAAVILVIAAAAVSAAATKSPAAPSPVASYEILRNFTYWGGRPQSALLEASPGVFYGTASEFDQGKGSVFRVSPDGAGGFTLTALHTFSGPDGQTPMSALVTAGDSYLYGTTVAGGEFGYGTVFKLSLDGSDFAVLHSFTGGDDGQHPMGALLADGEGFVGTTAGPDESDGGTVFRISADGTVATLHTFSGADGSHPWDALIRGTDDALYGTTRGGGTSDYGTIFRLSPDGLGGFEFNTVYEFTGSCLYPVGPLFQGGA